MHALMIPVNSAYNGGREDVQNEINESTAVTQMGRYALCSIFWPSRKFPYKPLNQLVKRCISSANLWDSEIK